MGKYKIKILQIARDDIEELYLYILADNARAALATAEKILDKIDTLAEFPLIGKIIPEKDLAKQEFRMLTIDSDIVFYNVIGDEVVIYRVLHGGRDYRDLLK
ncbi:MAG: type II toxin-antitoxin system RelE/ParE family toxin [Syntrophomonas sp.]